MLKRTPAALWFALLFALLGLPFISIPGMHVDASSELTCFYPCSAPVFRPTILGNFVPVMVLSYLGAFKAWLYQPILEFLEVTPAALRWPFLLLGAGSVWFLFAILDRVAGRRAAVAGALLLATDASFVIVTAIDFGPVAFLHFLLLAGMWLLLRFDQRPLPGYLAGAFFLFGLAMWHKALFIWMLGGLGAAALAVFPGRLWAHLSGKRVALAAAAFCLGAAPLLWYNMATAGGTFRTGKIMSEAAPLTQKVLLLKRTLDGSALFGFLTEIVVPAQNLRTPSRAPVKVAAALDGMAGGLDSNGLLYALIVALFLLPWLWFTPSRRAAGFAAVYIAAAWSLVIALPNTGGSIHHAILIWPLPHFLIAVAGAQLAARFGRKGALAMGAVLALMAAWNLLLVNRYAVQLEARGPRAIFTDAVRPLAAYVDSLEAPHVFAVDWGYGDTLCLFSDGELNEEDISYPLLSEPTRDTVHAWLAAPRAVFVGRVAADEVFPGVHQRLESAAAAQGYTRRTLKVIEDRNHRPRFEVFDFVK